jgi:acyl-CoA thioesterase
MSLAFRSASLSISIGGGASINKNVRSVNYCLSALTMLCSDRTEVQMTKDELAVKVATHMRSLEGEHVASGLTLEAVREGYARVALECRADMLNSHRTLHGGIIFTLADTAFAYACNSRNEAAVAQQVSIVYVSPGLEREILVAEAVEQIVQGRSGVYHVTVKAGDRLIAVFQGLSRMIGKKVLPDE